MGSTAGNDKLSAADERTLYRLFDPEGAPPDPIITIDSALPPDRYITDLGLLRTIKKRELEAIKLVESYIQPQQLSFTRQRQTPSVTEAKHAAYQECLNLLTQLALEHPQYASAYNNRAQLRRWRYATELLDLPLLRTSDPHADILEAVLTDLNEAIALASPPPGGKRLSPQQAKVLANAWMQRGAVFLGLSKQADPKAAAGLPAGSHDVEPLSWDQGLLEEEGSRCFFMAGLYGCEAGKGLACKTNPYAKMCGNIVREAMKREGVA